MNEEERAARVKNYLKQITGNDGLESLTDRDVSSFRGSRIEANPARLRLAKQGLEKTRLDKPLHPHETRALESIVLTSERPVIDVVDGDFVVNDPSWEYLNTDAVSHGHITNALPFVGRVETPDRPSQLYAGTGFLVGPDLLMTNRHVANYFALGLGARQLRFMQGQSAAVDFTRENREQAANLLTIDEIVMVHPYWDMALLRVSGLPAGTGHLKLDPTNPDAKFGSKVAIIGFPAYDDRTPDEDLMFEVFNNRFDIKRIQPGILHPRFDVNSFGRDVPAISHDASTLGGNSGSAVIDLESGHVLGLHFAGDYLLRNYAVSAHDLGRDSRVVAAGVDFVSDVQEGATPWEDIWVAADSGQESVPVSGAGSVGGSVNVAVNAGTGSVTIPLTVTVQVGEPGQA